MADDLAERALKTYEHVRQDRLLFTAPWTTEDFRLVHTRLSAAEAVCRAARELADTHFGEETPVVDQGPIRARFFEALAAWEHAGTSAFLHG